MVAALTTVAWWFGHFSHIVRRMPHPELGPTCEFRLCHAFTSSRRRLASTLTSAPGHIFLLLTLHKLFIMQQFFNLLLLLLYPVCTIFCAQENDPGRAVLWPWHTDIPRYLGWTKGFVNTSLPHARDFGITLPARIDRAMPPLRSAELFAPPPRDRLGMEPCPASSSDRIINAEHINQLSRFHAQSFKFLTCVVFRPCSHTLFVKRNFPYPC